MNWDTIFSAGTHESGNGQTREWTANDLDKLVKNTGKDSPIVIHHPIDQDKAYHFGKIRELRRLGNLLQARYKDVPEILQKAVDEGLKLAKSVSIDPDKMVVRHVGLLGAGQEPMIKDLGAFNFADDQSKSLLTYMFSQPKTKEGSMDPKDKKIQDLETEIKTLKAGKQTDKLQQKLDHAESELAKEKKAHNTTKEEFASFKDEQTKNALTARIDALADSGRIKPAEKDKVLGFAKAMDNADASMEFAAPDGTKEKVTPQEHYLRDLEARPENKDGLLAEFASSNHAGPASEDGDAFEDINKYA